MSSFLESIRFSTSSGNFDSSTSSKPFAFKNKSGNSRLLVSGMKATGSQFLYAMSDIFLISSYQLTAVYVYDTVIP